MVLEEPLKDQQRKTVCHGGDIPNTDAMVRGLSNMGSLVELFLVSEGNVESKVQEIMDAPPLVPVKGTMKTHQVISLLPGIIKYQDITCVCQANNGVLDCACYGLKIRHWCIVNPRIILVVEDDVRVKCMHTNRTNKFYWPSLRSN